MKRFLGDLLAFVLLIVGDILWRIIAKISTDMSSFITLHITTMWLIWASIVAAGRAFIGIIMLNERASPIVGLLEWILIFTVAHIFLCWSDTIWEPHDTFSTVLAFTLLPLFVPVVILSSASYLVACLRARRRRRPLSSYSH